MASGEMRAYTSVPGVSAEQIGLAVVNFLRTEKNQDAEGYRTETGYYIQSRERQNGIAKVAGLGTATVVEISANQFGTVSVNAGAGSWSDKIGAAAISAVVFMPLIALPAMGAFKQKKLTDSVFEFIESYTRTAQPESYGSASAGLQAFAQPAYQAEASSIQQTVQSRTSMNVVVCKFCGFAQSRGSSFCPSCGAPMPKELHCRECGASVVEGMKFCDSCGAWLAQGNACPSCAAELQQGQRFCHKCGADTQA